MTEITTCGQRITEALTLRKMRQADLCKITGINKTLMSHYVHDHFAPKMGNLHEMAKALKVSETWLMGYDTDIAENPDENQKEGINSPLYPVSSRKVPVLEGISDGLPNYKNEKHVSTTAAGVDLEVDFCLYATDDSMIGVRIGKGDIVFVQAQETVENGEIAAVAIEDDVMLRRIYLYEEQKVLMLRPENPAYDELVLSIDKATSIKILGKAVAFQAVL